MGAISYPIPAGSSARSEVARYVRQRGSEVIASNSAPADGEWSGVYFAAHREPDGQVWASVTLFAQHDGHVYIKVMSESMGPTAIGVGKSVLSVLTAPVGEYAQQWRAEAAAYQRRRADALAARGSWARLANPVTLTNGEQVREVHISALNRWKTHRGTVVRPRWDWFLSSWTPL